MPRADPVAPSPPRTSAQLRRAAHTAGRAAQPAFRLVSYNLLADQYAGSTYAQKVRLPPQPPVLPACGHSDAPPQAPEPAPQQQLQQKQVAVGLLGPEGTHLEEDNNHLHSLSLTHTHTHTQVLFNYCPPAALDFDYRSQLVLQELIGYNADVLCLQVGSACSGL